MVSLSNWSCQWVLRSNYSDSYVNIFYVLIQTSENCRKSKNCRKLTITYALIQTSENCRKLTISDALIQTCKNCQICARSCPQS